MFHVIKFLIFPTNIMPLPPVTETGTFPVSPITPPFLIRRFWGRKAYATCYDPSLPGK